MKNPKISVLINCLNGERYLRKAIDSVFDQTYRDWEIIFWDNGSTDTSAEIAKSYGERVKYFRSEETYPLGKARNLCMAQATGEFIAFLDCDDLWLPKKLEKQISLFEKDPEVALVFCDTIYFNEKGTICQIYRKFKPSRGRIFSELFRNYYLAMVSVVIRKAAIQDMKWFDERMAIIEEACLFFRLAYSHKADYVDEPLAKYRVHSNSMTAMNYGLVAAEREMFLQTCRDQFPNFDRAHLEDIKVFTKRTTQQKAIGKWLDHKSAAARKIIMKIKPKDFLTYGLLILTIFPSSIFFILMKLNYSIKHWIKWHNNRTQLFLFTTI